MTMTDYQIMAEIIESDDPVRITEYIRADPSRLIIDDDPDKDSCLHHAANEGKLKAVQCLVDLGADIDVRAGFLEKTALEEAAFHGHVSIVQYLISKGAKLYVEFPTHNPLFHAIYEDHIEVAKVLLSAGLDPHVTYLMPNGKLRNALVYATDLHNQKFVDLLIAEGCRMPVEGVDKPVNEAQIQEMLAQQREEDAASEEESSAHKDQGWIAGNGSEEQEIIAYVSQRFGPTDELALREIVPVLDDVHVAIHVIRPNNQHPFMTLFTTGMSSRAMKVPAGREAFGFGELLLLLPITWPHPQEVEPTDVASLWPVQALRQLAYLPHLQDTWYGPCHTVSFSDPPQPLGPNTKLTSALLVADKIPPLQLADNKSVKFFTVYPLYTEELGIVARLGIDELLDRLQKHQITPLVEPGRINVGLE